MFDKNRFAQILKNICETYESQRNFAEKSEINRTYLSQYMNMKLDKPPKPQILKKLAQTSNNIITYEELMQICGYFNVYNAKDVNIYTDTNKNLQKEKSSFLIDVLYNDDLSSQEFLAFQEICNVFKNNLINDKPIGWNAIKLQKDLLYHKLSNRNSLDSYIQQMLDTIHGLENVVETEKKYRNMKLDKFDNPNSAIVFVYGTIPAGIPIECIEDIIDTEEIPADMLKSGKQYFGLRVKGNSMENEYLDGDTLILEKVNDCESGDDCVVMVNR